MSRPRLLADHDLNERIILGTCRREPKIEFRHARDFALETAGDVELLEFAAAQHWLIVSHDVNTMIRAARQRIENEHPMSGLVMVHQFSPVGPTINDLVTIWTASAMEEWHNDVVFLPL